MTRINLLTKKINPFIHFSTSTGSKWQTPQQLFKTNTELIVKIRDSKSRKTLQCAFKVTIELIKNIKLAARQFAQVESLRHPPRLE